MPGIELFEREENPESGGKAKMYSIFCSSQIPRCIFSHFIKSLGISAVNGAVQIQSGRIG